MVICAGFNYDEGTCVSAQSLLPYINLIVLGWGLTRCRDRETTQVKVLRLVMQKLCDITIEGFFYEASQRLRL